MTHISKFPLPIERTDGAFVVTKKQALLLLAVSFATGVSCSAWSILVVVKGIL